MISMILAKRLLWLAAFSVFVSCTMHEEYTPPSPIELKPRQTKPPVYDQDIAPDKFGDEGLEPVDSEEDKSEDFDPHAARQSDIAAAERKNRARKLTDAAKKNIKIERKTRGQTDHSAPKRPKTEHVKKQEPAPEPKPEPKKVTENLDLDLDDLED